MARKLLGAAMVAGGFYAILAMPGGASLFVGLAVLCVGLLVFLGGNASFGAGAGSGGGDGAGFGSGDGGGGDSD